MEHLLGLIKVLNDYGILDMISIIISPIISILILFITLRCDKKQFKQQFANQQLEHSESMAIMKKHHEQTIQKELELNRISIMPYFYIEKDIKTRKVGDNWIFSVSLVNKGNGTAIELQSKRQDNSSDNCLWPLFESFIAVYGYSCPFDYEINVVNPNEKCSFEMYQSLKMPNANNKDSVTFKILFKDMYLNQYEQEFTFLFSENKEEQQIKIHRVSVNTPEIISV